MNIENVISILFHSESTIDFSQLIGWDLQDIKIKPGTLLPNGYFSGTGNIYLTLYNPNLENRNGHLFIVLRPHGIETIFGDLVTFNSEIIENSTHIPKGMQRISFDGETSKIEGIYFYGQLLDTSTKDKKEIDFWYRLSEVKPSAVKGEGQIIYFIAMKLASTKWIYISPGILNNFSISFNTASKPNQYIKGQLFLEADKPIKILTKFII